MEIRHLKKFAFFSQFRLLGKKSPASFSKFHSNCPEESPQLNSFKKSIFQSFSRLLVKKFWQQGSQNCNLPVQIHILKPFPKKLPRGLSKLSFTCLEKPFEATKHVWKKIIISIVLGFLAKSVRQGFQNWILRVEKNVRGKIVFF